MLEGQDAIDLWQQGVGAWNAWVVENPVADVSFEKVDFSEFSSVSFSDFKFPQGRISFADAIFGNGDVLFNGAVFGDGDIEFDRAVFGKGALSFQLAQFGDGNVSFLAVNFGSSIVSFRDAVFSNGDLSFDGAVFDAEEIPFRRVLFGAGGIYFRDTTFGDGTVLFADASLRGEVFHTGQKELLKAIKDISISNSLHDNEPTGDRNDLGSPPNLRRWLNYQTREASVLVATRAALRALPALAFVEAIHDRNTVLLPVFRAMAAPWTAGTWPSHREGVSKASARVAEAADKAANSADKVARAASRAGEAAEARSVARMTDAASAANTTAFVAGDRVVDRAVAAVSAAAEVAEGDFEEFEFWSEVSADAGAIERGLTVRELAGLPLWTGTTPDSSQFDWKTLKAALLATNDHWRAWTDWYDDRLAGNRGRPIIEQLELQRVLVPKDEDWKLGADVINPILLELEDKYRRGSGPVGASVATNDALPEQQLDAIEVEIGSDDRLHQRQSGPPEGEDPAHDDDLCDAWQVLRELSQSLSKKR